jgi:DNA repair protein RadC
MKNTALDSTSKLIARGASAVTDAELIGIIIGSNDLARQILNACHNNLHELGKLSITDLQRFHGIGESKAAAIAAVIEIGRRRSLSDIRSRPKISSSRDAYNSIGPLLSDRHHEEFWMLMLNRANEVIERKCISVGGTSGTVVDIKLALKTAIDHRASGFIAVHNHPSGNLEPSHADIDLTDKLKTAGRMIDMPMLDHLIISERGYYSFADEGLT